jgi:hypothetical protein
MFGLTLLLKQTKLGTSSGLERPSEDLAGAGGVVGSGDAEYDEATLESTLPIG